MSMNAHHCNMVFSPNRESALNKLENISKNRIILRKKISQNTLFYMLDNYEEWIWLSTLCDMRGYRAQKAYIDIDCTIRDLEYYIKPLCVYCKKEDIYYFDPQEGE